MLRARIAMLLFDAGLVEGSTPPETEQQLCANALQGLDALRRCANNALLTPAVVARSSFPPPLLPTSDAWGAIQQ